MSDHPSPFQPASTPHPEHAATPDPVSEVRQQEVIPCLKQVIEPTLHNNIVSLGMVRNLRLVDDYVYLRLYVGSHQFALEAAVQQSLASLAWCKKVYVQRCSIEGVKTTTAANLAAALTLQGATVGILDADVYDPNLPQMLDLTQTTVDVMDTPNGQRFLPLETHGLKVMSVGLLADAEHPLA